MRLPLNRAGALHRIARRANALQQGHGGEPITLEDIGVLLGVTRERVWHVKEKARGAFASRRARLLAGFLA